MKFFTLLFLTKVIMMFATDLKADDSERSDPRVIPITTRAPEEKKIYPIAIIGAGAAGTMAVERAVLNNNEVLLFTGAKKEQRRSRGTWVRKIHNVPGLDKYTRTVLELRNEVLEKLARCPLNYNLYVIKDSIYFIKKEADFFRLTDSSGHEYYAKYVVLATGMMDEQPHIQGSIRPILKYANGQTIVYCALCDGHRSFKKKTVVIGYSEAAAKTALLLAKKYQPSTITILTNGHAHQFTPDLLQQLRDKQISLLEVPIQAVYGDEAIKQLSGFELTTGIRVDAEIGFISLGIRPNNQLALQLKAQMDASGLVITDVKGESSVPNLFVIGDLQANSMKQIYTAWQHAVESLQLINQRMRD
jgi:thioredoxin reductase (NADPH)